jgi:hypothetical protein
VVPVTAAPTVNAPAATNSEASPAATAAPREAPISHSRKNPWKTPAGKLDDARYALIQAKYTVAVLNLPAAQRKNDAVMRVVLEAILDDADVSVGEYLAYGKSVAEDPARKRRVSDEAMRLVRQHGGSAEQSKTATPEAGGKAPEGQGAGSVNW